MATPAIRALRKHVGPHGQLIGIMRPYVAEVLAGTTWLDSQILCGKPPSRFRLAAPEVYQELRSARLDCVVLLTNSFRTGWIAWRSGARERIGYVGDARSWLLTKRIRPPRAASDGAPCSAIDAYMQLAEAAGCPREPANLELAITAEEERAAEAVWRQLELPAGERVVILNSGGAYGLAKHWPAEHFADLARRIVSRRRRELDRARQLWTRRAPDRPRDRHRAGHPRVVSLANIEQLPIGLTKACIRRARMLVTTDSGPRFLAIAFDKPVVTLFGPTDPAATATGHERESCLALSLDCQPCMERTCPLVHHRCMRELSVDRVYAAVAEHLEAEPNEYAA